MTKVDDTQRVILAAAGARDSGLVLPLPKSLKFNLKSATPILTSMIEAGLLSERLASAGEPSWRTDTDLGKFTLVVTEQGLSALGMSAQPTFGSDELGELPKTLSKKRQPKVKAAAPASTKAAFRKSESPRETKLGKLVAALRSKKGATIADLIDATGWQAHSVRGAISGVLKKKQGLSIVSTTTDGRGRVYRIAD